jgi:glycosyltransferase involved in cell wall biosynthesis
MIKISIDARMINHSGIGTYLKNLLPNLANKYNLILLGPKEILSKYEWTETISIIDCKSKIYSVREQIELWLKIPSCDIFICPHYNVPVLPVKARKKIVIIHDVYHLAFRNKLTLLQRLYSTFLINFAVRNYNKVITISRFSESEIIKYTGIENGKITTLHLGFNPAIKSLNKVEKESTRRKYNLPQKFIFFVGNIKPHKNLKKLLQAYNILIGKKITHKLVITGSRDGFITSDREIDGFLDRNKTLAENVIFTGYVDQKDLINIYEQADVFVFPSYYEGFGIPPIEAMMAGTPVVTSREASLPEICGDAALYCDAFQPEDIADKIEVVLNDEGLRNKLILKGKENLLRFTEEKFVSGWESIIKEQLKA